jgi:hypothetical protein
VVDTTVQLAFRSGVRDVRSKDQPPEQLSHLAEISIFAKESLSERLGEKSFARCRFAALEVLTLIQLLRVPDL